jgi:benzoate membrane transport protein
VDHPQFSLAATFSLALPMVLVALTGQFMPGMAVLRNAGYRTPASPLISASALGGLLLAPFGCHGLNLAAVTASLCTGREAHENPRGATWQRLRAVRCTCCWALPGPP